MKKFKKSKFWRIASEGATTDGREISREWLEQMAASYNPAVYTARINLEHIRGINPEGPFRAYGDVTALKTEVIEGKLHLLAQLDPTADMVALIKKRQKVFTSMEIDQNFAKTGSAYLVGLGITDSPASLGTEMLAFSAQSGVLAGRKQRPENLFSAGHEVQFDLEDDQPETPALVERIKAMFNRQAQTETEIDDASQAIEALAGELQQQGESVAALSTQFASTTAALAELTATVADIKTALDSEPQPGQFHRSPAPGSAAAAETDC